MNRDSGRFKGQRHIVGGRSEVWQVLYLATVSDIQTNLFIRAKYQALIARGKATKVAITACSYKLLQILYALVRDRVESQNKNTVKA